MENECRHEFEIRPGVKPWIFAKCRKCGFSRPLRQNYSFTLSAISLLGLAPYLYLRNLDMNSTVIYLITVALYLVFGVAEVFVFMLYLRRLKPSKLDRYFETQPAE